MNSVNRLGWNVGSCWIGRTLLTDLWIRKPFITAIFRIFAILFKINIILEVREKTVFSSLLLHFQSVSFPVYLFRNKAHGTNTPFCISNRCRLCDPFSPLNHRRHWNSFWRAMLAWVIFMILFCPKLKWFYCFCRANWSERLCVEKGTCRIILWPL